METDDGLLLGDLFVGDFCFLLEAESFVEVNDCNGLWVCIVENCAFGWKIEALR